MGLLLNILVKYFFSDLQQLLPRQHQGATQGDCVAACSVLLSRDESYPGGVVLCISPVALHTPVHVK